MPNHNEHNRIMEPIDIAVKRLEEQESRVMESVVGPAVRQRKTLINGRDADEVIDTVLRQWALRQQGGL